MGCYNLPTNERYLYEKHASSPVCHSAYSYYPKEVLATFKDDVMTFAHKEGLDAHANSLKVRFEED